MKSALFGTAVVILTSCYLLNVTANGENEQHKLNDCMYFSCVESKGVSVFSGAGSKNASEICAAAVTEKSISLLRSLFSVTTVSECILSVYMSVFRRLSE